MISLSDTINPITTKDIMTTHRIITLTDRAPIKIVDDDWPVIASTKDYEGQVECQANRSWWLKVRQHEDGRVIVYGGFDTAFQSESNLRAGELLAADESRHMLAHDGFPETEIVAAIKRVAAAIHGVQLAQPCIADLPPVEI